jgi:cytochrome P450
MIYAVDEDGKGKLTREQVIDNVLLLVAAGTETSSSVLTMLMLLLGLHPNVTKKLALEQEEWRSRAGDAMTYEDLNDLPYLDAVVKEALRLGAITGGFPRMATETLVVDGYQIPKGWSVFGNYRLSHYLDPITRKADGSHMDVQKGFLPERWLSPETTPSEFLSFGSGPRYAVCDIRYFGSSENAVAHVVSSSFGCCVLIGPRCLGRYCLGANLALLEIKVFLAMMTRKVDFELLSDRVEWNPASMIPKPADGAMIRARHRN